MRPRRARGEGGALRYDTRGAGAIWLNDVATDSNHQGWPTSVQRVLDQGRRNLWIRKNLFNAVLFVDIGTAQVGFGRVVALHHLHQSEIQRHLLHTPETAMRPSPVVAQGLFTLAMMHSYAEKGAPSRLGVVLTPGGLRHRETAWDSWADEAHSQDDASTCPAPGSDRPDEHWEVAAAARRALDATQGTFSYLLSKIFVYVARKAGGRAASQWAKDLHATCTVRDESQWTHRQTGDHFDGVGVRDPLGIPNPCPGSKSTHFGNPYDYEGHVQDQSMYRVWMTGTGAGAHQAQP